MKKADLKALVLSLEETIKQLNKIQLRAENAIARKSRADRYLTDRAYNITQNKKVVSLSDALRAVEIAWAKAMEGD